MIESLTFCLINSIDKNSIGKSTILKLFYIGIGQTYRSIYFVRLYINTTNTRTSIHVLSFIDDMLSSYAFVMDIYDI